MSLKDHLIITEDGRLIKKDGLTIKEDEHIIKEDGLLLKKIVLMQPCIKILNFKKKSIIMAKDENKALSPSLKAEDTTIFFCTAAR